MFWIENHSAMCRTAKNIPLRTEKVDFNHKYSVFNCRALFEIKKSKNFN